MYRAERQGSEAGVEFDAPRLIPAIRAQIREIEDPERASEGNLTAFKNGVGTPLSAMQADLNQVGVTDTVTFYARSDSITRDRGVGAGDVVAQVERLIEIYEEKMRTRRRSSKASARQTTIVTVLSKHQGQKVFSTNHSAYLSRMVNSTAGTISARSRRLGVPDASRLG